MHERKAEATELLNETALPLQRMRMGNRPIEDTSDIRNAYAQGWRFSLSSSLGYLFRSFRFLLSQPPLRSTLPSFLTRSLSLSLPFRISLFPSSSIDLFVFNLRFLCFQVNFPPPNCRSRITSLVSIFIETWLGRVDRGEWSVLVKDIFF